MAGADDGRFVSTEAIKTAVRGREIEILGKLGIDHRGGDHIRCPYDRHEDKNPSWRWNGRTNRALCTCIEAAGEKAHSIFDVVATKLGLAFADAKIWITEALGRADLIRTKRGNGGSGQKTDPESLLNPGADNRDDALVYTYLGARLGVEADQVPRPSTKVVGIKSLAYFDLPAQGEKNGKPQFVGNYACAVFQTIAPDGRRHAHRVYLCPGGHGKAELGVDANGRARDPKKSATRLPGAPNINGSCVVWGNPDNQHIILAEGIETACAVAYAFRAEIDHGEIAVMSAITAGGIEAFLPWPNTRRITVAADRDEAKPGAGFKRGERAARRLATRLPG